MHAVAPILPKHAKTVSHNFEKWRLVTVVKASPNVRNITQFHYVNLRTQALSTGVLPVKWQIPQDIPERGRAAGGIAKRPGFHRI
jgi:hypothetical protein